MWALLVAIERYANEDWPNVLGARKDVDETWRYLTHELNVPSDHILVLKDAEATRDAIITKFREHLIDNCRIARGDALFFHYSGHGSYMKAPEGWTVVEQKTGDVFEDDMVEVLVPWDDGVDRDDEQGSTCSIPDRTLAALIQQAASAHGNNITIVLDCCSSGHGTRGGASAAEEDEWGGEMVTRSIDPRELVPLHSKLDDEIISHSRTKGARRSRARFSAVIADHVLMAACGPREKAMGNAKCGGIFTYLWLRALRNKRIFPRTYAGVLKAIEADIAPLRAKCALNQHPQCDSIVRDRLIFQETTMGSGYFEARREEGMSSTEIAIDAGRIQDIQVGTLFELHIMGQNLQSQRTLGSAIAKVVNTAKTVAEIGEGVILAGVKCMALVVQRPGQLRYAVVNDASDSDTALRAIDRLRSMLVQVAPQEKPNWVEVTEREDAALHIKVADDGSMTLHRRDSMLSKLRNMPPKLTAEEVQAADFQTILSGIARFNRLLTLESVTHPFESVVTLELRRLVRKTYTEETIDGFYLRASGDAVIFDGDEAVINPSEEEDEEYAIILRNDADTALYAEVWYFDPNTYAIQPCYISPSGSQPSLPSRGQLQIGASTERAEPLVFYLPEEASSDTIFIKTFLTDNKARLDFLKQGELVGLDGEGQSVILGSKAQRAGEGQAETKGRWDTILRRITIVSEQVR